MKITIKIYKKIQLEIIPDYWVLIPESKLDYEVNWIKKDFVFLSEARAAALIPDWYDYRNVAPVGSPAVWEIPRKFKKGMHITWLCFNLYFRWTFKADGFKIAPGTDEREPLKSPTRENIASS